MPFQAGYIKTRKNLLNKTKKKQISNTTLKEVRLLQIFLFFFLMFLTEYVFLFQVWIIIQLTDIQEKVIIC